MGYNNYQQTTDKMATCIKKSRDQNPFKQKVDPDDARKWQSKSKIV